MRTHADDGKIYKIVSDVVACCLKFGMAVAWPLLVAHIVERCQEVGANPRDADEHAIYSERQVERPGAKEYQDGRDPGSRG
jgi:hypothetical protein